MHIDAIITASGMSASQVVAALSLLELDGGVVGSENGYYRIS